MINTKTKEYDRLIVDDQNFFDPNYWDKAYDEEQDAKIEAECRPEIDIKEEYVAR
jgi:hypothetical protein